MLLAVPECGLWKALRWQWVSSHNPIEYSWIDTDSALQQFVAQGLQEDNYFLDTEFHREKTYFPQLALVQIALKSQIAVIDPIAVNMQLLRPLFEGPGLCVLHAAQQDLDVLAQSCGFIPSRILDTQLCAGFIGFTQPSLASLLQSYLKITVPKGDRLTDWLRRPLTNDQLNYAASDVAYLEELSSIIFTDLHERGRMTWAAEACEELRTRPTGPNSPDQAWLRVKDVRTLKGRARWVAQAIAEWREVRAIDLDLPPRHVLSDVAILGLAQKAPTTTEDLLHTRGVDNRHAGGSQGKALLAAIQTGLANSRDGDLQFPSSDTDDMEKGMRPAVTLVSAWVTELARQSSLDVGLLGTRKDIVDLLAGAPQARMKVGWRADIVGRDIEDLVAGRKALTFTGAQANSGLQLVDVATA
jgi:ribonuclease D